MPDESAATAWHLDKKVPIALLGGIVLQTVFGAVYFAIMVRDISDTRRELTRIEADTGRRVEKLEASDDRQAETLRVIREQLARIDERLGAVLTRLASGTHP